MTPEHTADLLARLAAGLELVAKHSPDARWCRQCEPVLAQMRADLLTLSDRFPKHLSLLDLLGVEVQEQP